MLVGYARISTHDQMLDLQRDALEKSGCTEVFTDTASGAKADRPELDQALKYILAGDTLVVWKPDRLSLTENIDTTTSGGKLVFHLFGALAEFEWDIIRERTQAGLAAARARGRMGGRPKTSALNTQKKVAMAQALYDDKRNSIADICKTLRVSRSTLYRYIRVE